jgi:outer membrane protein assembly factor BamB
LILVTAAAADWPQFRGLERNGVSKETGLPLEWSEKKGIVWKTAMPGPGTSSPIVFGDRVYVTCFSGYGVDREAPGDLADLKRHLVCVERATGKILWTSAEVDPDRNDAPFGAKNGCITLHGYASHTPAADESGVYAYFGAAGAVGYSHDGEKKWSVSLGKKGKAQLYGSAASPLLHGNLFIVNANIETAGVFYQGDMVALDKRTGREVWREKAGNEWSSPTLVKAGEKLELVVGSRHPGPWLGLDPDTGKRLWECKTKQGIGTPIAHGGVIYVNDGGHRAAIRAGGRGDVTSSHLLWESSSGPRISSMVYHDGHLYWSMDGHGCNGADASSGKVVYRDRLGAGGDCYASPLAADGRIYYVSRDMGTYVLAAGPKYELLAHNKIADDKSIFNGSPAVSRGQLFLRSDKYLYCIGVKK